MRCIPADGFLQRVTATYDYGGIALLYDERARDQPSLTKRVELPRAQRAANGTDAPDSLDPLTWTELFRRTLRETLSDDCLGLAAQLAY
jgi:hypothetical protein